MMEGMDVLPAGEPLLLSTTSSLNLWERLLFGYKDLMSRADPRTSAWFLMDTPWPTMIICAIYLTFVRWGPRFMQSRSPIECRNVMIVYNLVLVAFSAWMVFEFLVNGWLAGYSLRCQPVDYGNSEKALRMARALWWYYFSKLVELMDTVFFVLRKKFGLITFLHVFHHAVMPVSWWWGVKFVAGGFSSFGAMLNSAVHVFMYAYYGVAALGPAYQRYLWWKKYLTKMQLVQFALVAVHCVQMYFIECDFPMLFVTWVLSYMLIFIALFTNFYKRAYQKHSSRRSNGSALTHTKDSNGTSSGNDDSLLNGTNSRVITKDE